MEVPEMKGLSYDECLPIFQRRMENRMKWIFEDDLDRAYERERDAAALS